MHMEHFQNTEVTNASLNKRGIKNLSDLQLHRFLITKRLSKRSCAAQNLSKSIRSVSSYGWAPHAFLTQFNKPSIKGRYLEEGKLIGCRGISGHFNWYPLKIHEKDFKPRKKKIAWQKLWQIYNTMIEILYIMSYLTTHLCHITQLFLLHCSAKYSSPFTLSLHIKKEQN